MFVKVLFISEYFLEAQGGGERSASKLIKAISRRGVDTKVVYSNKNFSVTNPLRFIYFPLYTIYLVWKYHKSYDVIHCLNSSSIYSILLKPIIKKPYIIHVNSYVNLCPKGTLMYKDKLELKAERECSKNCTLRTCLDCCKNSGWIGIKEFKNIPILLSVVLWVRYKFAIFLLKRFDKLISVSKVTESVCQRKGIDKVTTIYYGA